MKHLPSLFALALITSAVYSPTVLLASPAEGLSSFTKACADAAQEDFSRSQGGSWGMVVVDESSAAGRRVSSVYRVFEEMTNQSVNLIAIPLYKETSPRLSRDEARRATSIQERFSQTFSYSPMIERDLPGFVGSETTAHYRCITDTCPPNAQCAVVYPHDKGKSFLRYLRGYRRFFEAGIRWAERIEPRRLFVQGFNKPFNASRATAKYNRAEANVVAAIKELPQEMYLIEAYIQKK